MIGHECCWLVETVKSNGRYVVAHRPTFQFVSAEARPAIKMNNSVVSVCECLNWGLLL